MNETLNDSSPESNKNIKSSPNASKEQRLETSQSRLFEELHREREKADRLVELERKRADNEEVYAISRQENDQFLAQERNRTDQEVEQTLSLLSNERDAHFKTKVAVTTRDQFLAIVSHDLKNPLSAITLSTQLLLDSLEESLARNDILHWIEIIRRNASSMDRMISDLLDVERIASGKMTLTVNPWDIKEIIHETLMSLIPTAKNQGIRIEESLPAGPLLIEADKDRLMQVFFNILGNALKFVPNDGLITIQAMTSQEELQIAIRDNGPGIPSERLDTIFERFSQLNNNDRRGLGLGLYISRWIIESHRGRIWVESSLGKGSTFIIAVPWHQS